MFGLPKTTEFNKKIPKQKFYEKLDITPALKRVFVEQIKAIYWTNKIAASTVNLAVGKSVTELEVFKIELTSQSLDLSALQLVDKAIPYHIIFALCYNDRYQLVSSYKSNNTSLDKDCPKASTGGAILKPLLEEGNKRGGDRIRSLFSSLEQPSSQEDWIATQSATARNDGNSTGSSNTLTLNKVSSSSVTLSACKQATSPQGEALEKHTIINRGSLKKGSNTFFSTSWLPEAELQLPLNGLDLDSVYEAILRYIAGDELKAKEGTYESLQQSVERAEQRQKLMKQIDKLQKKVNREVQFSIQVELNAQLKALKRELEALL